jgi:protein CpxP
MKSSFLTLLAAFALTISTAAAQTSPPNGGGMQGGGGGYGRMQGTPEEMAKRQTERMTQELGLNADQATKVQQIQTARAQEMQAMRGQGGGDRDKMREQMQASRTKYDAQFKEVLTADQYTKYTSMQGNRGGGMGRPGMNAPGAEVEKLKAKTKDGEKIKAKEDKLKLKADGVKVKTEN